MGPDPLYRGTTSKGGPPTGDGSRAREFPTGIHPRWLDQRGPHPGRMRSGPVSGRKAPRSHVRRFGGLTMNKGGITLWGFVGTIVLTSVLAGSQALGLTRMNIPFMLGSMVTSDRDRAKVIGFGMHVINGWLFATIYAA